MSELTTRTKTTLVVLVMTAVILWATTFSVGKHLLEVVPPVTLEVVRCLFALVVLLPISLKRDPRDFVDVVRKEWKAVVMVGVVGFGVAYVFEILALSGTTSVNQSVLINLQAMYVVVFNRLVYKQKIHRNVVVGGSVAISGIAVLLFREGFALSPDTYVGDLMTIFGAALFWGLYSSLAAPVVRRRDPSAFLTWTIVFGAVFMSAIALATEPTGWHSSLTVVDWALLVYMGVAAIAGAYSIWFYCLRRLPSERVAAFLYLTPLFAVVFGSSFLGEVIDIRFVVGAVLLIGGLAYVEFGKRSPIGPAAVIDSVATI